MIYETKTTSQRGQVLLSSKKQHANSPASEEFSIQLPENKAIQICHAFHVCERINKIADLSIDEMAGDEAKKILRHLKIETKIIENNY